MKCRKFVEKSELFFIGLIITVFLLLHETPLHAQMSEVSNSDLSQICAQAGVVYNWGDSRLNISYDSFRISDSDSDPLNWLEFNNISISGPGGSFTLDEYTNEDYPWLMRFNSLNITSVTTVDDETRTVLQMVDSTNTNPRTITIGNLVFCSQDLGSIEFDMKNLDSTVYSLTASNVGLTGVEFEYLSNWEIDNFSYEYNTAGGSLDIAGIHLSESASGSPDNPSSWSFAGRFRIGDIIGGTIDFDNDSGNTPHSNPATINVATTTSGGTTSTSIYVNLPMKGTLRAESVGFGGTDFGPVAIDGITSHYMAIRLNPGD